MANKPKIQGTKFESATRDLLLDWGFKAYRLAEGGLKDEGDVQVELPDEVVFECKKLDKTLISTKHIIKQHKKQTNLSF